MSEGETRYAKTERIKRDKAKHETRIQKFAIPIEEEFVAAVEKERPACVRSTRPHPWSDYDSNPERREDYETDAPTAEEAEALCAECPIRAVQFGGNGLCTKYALATKKSHGVWGGLAREDDKWLHKTSTAKAT